MNPDAREWVPPTWAQPSNPPAGKALPPKEKDGPSQKNKKPINYLSQQKAASNQPKPAFIGNTNVGVISAFPQGSAPQPAPASVGVIATKPPVIPEPEQANTQAPAPINAAIGIKITSFLIL